MVEKSKLDEDKEGKAVDPSHYHGMIDTLLYLRTTFTDANHAGCQDTRSSTSDSLSKHIDIRYHFVKEHVENEDYDGIPKRPTMYLNLWSYKAVRHRYSNPMIQPKQEGSTLRYPLVSVEVLSDKVLKLKNFKKEALLKLFKLSNQERVEVTKLTTDRLVNGSSCDGIDMVIKNLELEPKVDAIMRDFLESAFESVRADAVVNIVTPSLDEKHNQLMKLMRFLMGLDDTYMQIRSSILYIETLPDVRSAYAIISNEESHRVASGSISKTSQRSQTSAFTANVSNRLSYLRS
nr:ribonuclease H-like domain-containing protein [Tanacetum cinerariifolium]